MPATDEEITSLAAAGFTHIEIRCPCGAISQIPFRMLRAERRITGETTFASLAGRIGPCPHCGRKPEPADAKPWTLGMNFTPFMLG